MFTVGTGNDCFVLVACKYREIFFLVTKGYLTLVFYKGVNSLLELTHCHHLFPQDQGATKVLSDSPGLVKVLVGLAISYGSLPDG